MASFDALLDSKIGSFGKWQLFLFVLVMIPSNIPTSMIPQLANLSPKFVCSAPWFKHGWAFDDVVNLTRSLAKLQLSDNSSKSSVDTKCHRFDLSALPASAWNGSLSEQRSTVLQFSSEMNLTLQTCPGPWLYDAVSAPYQRSLIEEFDFVCDRQGMIPNSAVMHMVGMMFGVLFGGQLGDHFGRRPVICGVFPLSGLFCLLIPFSPSYLVFFSMRIAIGFFKSTAYCCGYVYFMELTNYRRRNILCVIDGLVYYLFGQNLIILTSFLVQDWRWMHVVCGVIIMISSTVNFFFLPESPRYLVAKGRSEEALRILRKAAFLNKGHHVSITESDIAPLFAPPINVNRKSNPSLWHRFLTPLREWHEFIASRRTLKLWVPLSIVWFGVASVFFGISYYGVRLSGNPYLVAFFMTITCIPTKLLQLFLYEKFKRKAPLVGLMSLACCFCYLSFASMVTFGGSGTFTVTAATLCLSCITTVFDMTYLITNELFSSLHRSKALGSLSFVSRCGVISGMFVERHEQSWSAAPLLIFSILLTSAVFASALLPSSAYETMGDHIAACSDVNEEKLDNHIDEEIEEVKDNMQLNHFSNNRC